jgi:hypothetical protein
MARFFGLQPNSKTRKVAENFENQVSIRRNNRRLLGKVYADIEDSQWAVSIAYNMAMEPGLWGKENDLEVKYSYQPHQDPVVSRLETQCGDEVPIPAVSFHNPNEFVIWALRKESAMAHPA